MKILRKIKLLLLLATIFTLGFLSISLSTYHHLSTTISSKQSPSLPVGVSLRHVVHLKVNGSKTDIVEQYTSQLYEYFRKDNLKNEDNTVYRRRQSLVEKFCKKNHTDKSIRPTKNKFIYLQHPPLLYCPVAKAGSTFWRRVLEVILKGNPKRNSPFQILQGIPPHFDFTLGNHDQEVEYKPFLTSRNRFLFTRNPYHRLFSVFIDKFLPPNHYMWRFGERAIKKFRTTAYEGDRISGSSLRFDEFIKYINAQDKRRINDHVKPVSYTCDLCNFEYHVIGKVETFETDVNYILKRIGAFNRDIVIHDMKLEKDLDQVVDNVVRAFSLREGWLEYISWHAGMQRLWRQLQIDGLIDMTDTYPFSPEQSHNVTVVEYVNVALEAFRRSSPAAEHTKREAYLQAYSMVEPEELEKLREGFLSDFEMFDYEQRPAELFDMDRTRKWDYDYFDLMQLK